MSEKTMLEYWENYVPEERTQKRNNKHAAEFLVFTEDPKWVTDMYYKLDGEEDGELSYKDFILLLIKELQVNRQHGYVRLFLYNQKKTFFGSIAILIRKQDLYVLGVQDRYENVYELGIPEEGNPYQRRYFFGSALTGFGEQYSELFPDNRNLLGLDLGYGALGSAIYKIVSYPDRPWEWKESIGVFALMFSECARFKWFQDVLFVVMRNYPRGGDERWAPDELRGYIILRGNRFEGAQDEHLRALGKYDFMIKLRWNWKNISECARMAVDHEDYDFQPDEEKYTMAGIENLKRNPGWAKDSLSILKWEKGDPEGVHLPGEGDGIGYGNGGGYYFHRTNINLPTSLF